MNPYRLVIFDMDGTLTEEILDFAAIRGEIGVPAGAGVLEFIIGLPPEKRAAAEAILHGHEIAAANKCALHAGATEVLARLKARRIPTALLTRNSAACARTVLDRHGLALDFVATRDDLPHKPHRDSVLRITRHFGILPQQTLLVGDYLYDMQAAQAAGTAAALLLTRAGAPRPEFAHMATHVIEKLTDVLALVDGSGRSNA